MKDVLNHKSSPETTWQFSSLSSTTVTHFSLVSHSRREVVWLPSRLSLEVQDLVQEVHENGVLQAKCQKKTVQLSLEEAGCCLCNLREHIMVKIDLNKKQE